MATSQQPTPHADTRGPLAEALIALAGTPDDVPTIGAQLDMLAQLAADRVAGVDYASITALRGDAYVTVAASSELADAVDQAQYADEAGPCLQALKTGTAVTVPDIAATIDWPGFHEAAADLGLHASVSIPVVAASGATIAVLNLYGRDADTMAPLIVGAWAIYDPSRPLPADDLQPLDAGGVELLQGFAEAQSVRATIQLAIATIKARTQASANDAYVALRLHAADIGLPLPDAAHSIVQQRF